jgi:hypothetical protein
MVVSQHGASPPMQVIKTLPKDFSKITQIGKQKIICSPQEPQGDSASKAKVIYHMLINQTAIPGAALSAHQEAISSPSTEHRTCPSPMQRRSRHFLHHPGGTTRAPPPRATCSKLSTTVHLQRRQWGSIKWPRIFYSPDQY